MCLQGSVLTGGSMVVFRIYWSHVCICKLCKVLCSFQHVSIPNMLPLCKLGHPFLLFVAFRPFWWAYNTHTHTCTMDGNGGYNVSRIVADWIHPWWLFHLFLLIHVFCTCSSYPSSGCNIVACLKHVLWRFGGPGCITLTCIGRLSLLLTRKLQPLLISYQK